MTLTFNEIFTLVFTSSVLAAALTSAFNWYLQKENYKRDYYKRILEKRLEAYATVEHLVGQLKGVVQLENGEPCPIVCAMGKDFFNRFLVSIVPSSFQSFWISDEVAEKLTELNIFLLREINNKIDENGDYESQLVRLGVHNRDALVEFREEFTSMLYHDFLNLHDIKKFVEKSKGQKSFMLEGKSKDLQKS